MPRPYRSFGKITVHGIPVDQCVRSLVLGLKTGDIEMAIPLAVELGKSHPNILAQQLILFSLEYIGPVNPAAVYYVAYFYLHSFDFVTLSTLIIHLIRSPKSRINSYFKWERPIPLDSQDLSSFTLIKEKLPNIQDFHDLDILRYCIESIWQSKKEYQENTIERKFHPPIISTGRRKKSSILVWRAFDQILHDNPYYLFLRDFFLSNKVWSWFDNRNKLVHAHLVHCQMTSFTVESLPLFSEKEVIHFLHLDPRKKVRSYSSLKSPSILNNPDDSWSVIENHYNNTV
jgi:hypothetical protein